MNFKQLVSKVNLHAGLQGTVVSVEATDYQEYLAEAVRSAWIDLQNQRPDWKFLREIVTFSTSAGVSDYTNSNIMASAGNSFGVAKWDRNSFFKDGEEMKELDWETYRKDPDKYNNTEDSKVFVVSEFRPQGLIIPSAGQSYSIQAEYYRTPQSLTSNTDSPLLPEEFHYIIVWRALEDVAAYLGNRSIYERHEYKHDVLENKLMRSQVPARKIKKKPFVTNRFRRA